MTKLKLAKTHRETALANEAAARAVCRTDDADMYALAAEMYGDLIRQYETLEEENDLVSQRREY